MLTHTQTQVHSNTHIYTHTHAHACTHTQTHTFPPHKFHFKAQISLNVSENRTNLLNILSASACVPLLCPKPVASLPQSVPFPMLLRITLLHQPPLPLFSYITSAVTQRCTLQSTHTSGTGWAGRIHPSFPLDPRGTNQWLCWFVACFWGLSQQSTGSRQGPPWEPWKGQTLPNQHRDTQTGDGNKDVPVSPQ